MRENPASWRKKGKENSVNFAGRAELSNQKLEEKRPKIKI